MCVCIIIVNSKTILCEIHFDNLKLLVPEHTSSPPLHLILQHFYQRISYTPSVTKNGYNTVFHSFYDRG